MDKLANEEKYADVPRTEQLSNVQKEALELFRKKNKNYGDSCWYQTEMDARPPVTVPVPLSNPWDLLDPATLHAPTVRRDAAPSDTDTKEEGKCS
jgi:hypothetical protein